MFIRAGAETRFLLQAAIYTTSSSQVVLMCSPVGSGRCKCYSRNFRQSRYGVDWVHTRSSHGIPQRSSSPTQSLSHRCEAVCKLGLEEIVSKRLTSVYRSGPSRTWIKIKNPKAPAATRALDGTF